MINLPNFKDYCEAACIRLWGEPDSRTKKELRWNSGGSNDGRSYDIRKRAWYDHGAQRGGSTLDLVDYTKGRPKRDLRGTVLFEVWREAKTMGIVPDPAPPPKNGGGKPVLATYPYTDENKVLLFEVVPSIRRTGKNASGSAGRTTRAAGFGTSRACAACSTGFPSLSRR